MSAPPSVANTRRPRPEGYDRWVNRRTASETRSYRQRVVVLQEFLPHYRLPFFEALDRRLEQQGRDFHLVFGSAATDDTRRRAATALRSSAECPVRSFRTLGVRLVWQPTRCGLPPADLVIVEQGSRLALNYVLMVRRRTGGPMLGLWGHGTNRAATRKSRLGEWTKRLLITQCDWWFAYSDGVASYVESMGVPRSRITSVGNATDTVSLASATAAQTADNQASTRARYSLGDGPIVLVLGSLYAERRIDVLFDVADVLRGMRPDAVIAIAGGGPMADEVANLAATRTNVRSLGTLHGPDLAAVGAVSSISINVGVVGLGILDSFALGLPMIACDLMGHGPEIDYLADGVNGLLLAEDASAQDFATALVGLLGDEQRRRQLAAASQDVANEATIERMAERFSLGIASALEARRS